jgi:hypothetical protein
LHLLLSVGGRPFECLTMGEFVAPINQNPNLKMTSAPILQTVVESIDYLVQLRQQAALKKEAVDEMDNFLAEFKKLAKKLKKQELTGDFYRNTLQLIANVEDHEVNAFLEENVKSIFQPYLTEIADKSLEFLEPEVTVSEESSDEKRSTRRKGLTNYEQVKRVKVEGGGVVYPSLCLVKQSSSTDASYYSSLPLKAKDRYELSN